MIYAAIIKHAFRSDADIRVDLYEVEDQDSIPRLKEHIQNTLLGEFELIAFVSRVSDVKKVQVIND